MATNNTVYIAETDADGNIVCLWLSDTAKRGARPIRDPAKHIESVASAECSGAPRDAIERWLQQAL